ncbi:MAG: SDR family NAD(P)-dependent oxidoreductase [Pseudonocardiaceae bacterium]
MNPIAVLTGASRGIGKAILARLVSDGYECLVIGLSAPEALPGVVRFLEHDLADLVSVAAAAQAVRSHLNGLGRPATLLVNNAGGAHPRPAGGLGLDDVRADITLNLLAPMLLADAVVGGMRAASDGAIVNISSTAGRTGVAYLHTYSAAKAGLIAFTQSLAAECAADGVRVNCVCPGAVDTRSARDGRQELSRLHGQHPHAYADAMVSRTGLGRLINADEVAEVVSWLAADAGRAVNGQTINFCGTLSMG